MTAKYNSLTVILGEGVREDDLKPIMAAISQLRHVISVDYGETQFEGYAAAAQRDNRWRERLYELARLGPEDA